MFDAQAEGVFRSFWGAPCRIDCEGVDPAGGGGVGLVVDGVDRCDDVTEQSIDFGDCFSPQGRKHCNMRVVGLGEHIEDDPRSYGATLRFVPIGRRRCVGSRCARLVRPGYPGDGGDAGVVVEKVVEGFVHRSEDADDVALSTWRGWHLVERGGVLKEDEVSRTNVAFIQAPSRGGVRGGVAAHPTTRNPP